jgi:hypothetical protein
MVPAWRFFAVAPWRVVQAAPQAQQKIVPVSGGFTGGAEGDGKERDGKVHTL